MAEDALDSDRLHRARDGAGWTLQALQDASRPRRSPLRQAAWAAIAAALLALVLLGYRQPELFLNWAGALLC